MRFGSAVNLCKMSPGSGVISFGQSVINGWRTVNAPPCDQAGTDCFYHLLRLRLLRRLLGCDVTVRLVSALVC